MNRNQVILSVITLLALSLFVTACGGGQTVEKVETVQVEEVVEVEKEVTVEVEAEAAAEPTEAPAQTTEETAAPAAQEGGSTLEIVKNRGVLNCGVSGTLVGFSFLDPDTGNFTGFDVDGCRTVAAAVLGDANAVEYRGTTAQERFPVLQAGEIDVLVRNTTWTISRDTSLGFNFAPTTFYDGQGMMVRKDSGVTNLEDLEGATICVQAGTTTEKNLADVYRALGVSYEPVVFPDNPTTTEGYASGRCDALTTDKSGLIAIKTTLEVPEDHVILEATMSKEPLGPLVRHGDDQWFDIVKWVTFGTFQAEELGITSENVEEMAATSEDPVVRNLLGAEGDLGQALGLDNDFMVKVIKQVGNYGEIFDRNLGPDTPFNIGRGVNAQWTDGGLIYSPPFR
jgi:general L-amino acid transport system substrate-binding protein